MTREVLPVEPKPLRISGLGSLVEGFMFIDYGGSFLVSALLLCLVFFPEYQKSNPPETPSYPTMQTLNP